MYHQKLFPNQGFKVKIRFQAIKNYEIENTHVLENRFPHNITFSKDKWEKIEREGIKTRPLQEIFFLNNSLSRVVWSWAYSLFLWRTLRQLLKEKLEKQKDFLSLDINSLSNHGSQRCLEIRHRLLTEKNLISKLIILGS